MHEAIVHDQFINHSQSLHELVHANGSWPEAVGFSGGGQRRRANAAVSVGQGGLVCCVALSHCLSKRSTDSGCFCFGATIGASVVNAMLDARPMLRGNRR